MGQLVGDDRQHEPERADQPDPPRHGRLDPGLELAKAAGDGDGDDGDDEDQRQVEADLDPHDPGDRDAVHRAPSAWAAVTASVGAGSSAGAVRRASRPAPSATSPARTTITTPRTIVVSDQKSNGKSWTRRSVRGSNVNDPAGKNSLWKRSNTASNATDAMMPATTIPTMSPRMPVAIADQARAACPPRRA